MVFSCMRTWLSLKENTSADFFIKGYPHSLPLKWKKTPYVNFAVSFAATQAAGVSHRKSRVNSLALQFSKLSFGARYEGLTVICRKKS